MPTRLLIHGRQQLGAEELDHETPVADITFLHPAFGLNELQDFVRRGAVTRADVGDGDAFDFDATVAAERDNAISERDAALAERDAALEESAALRERVAEVESLLGTPDDGGDEDGDGSE